MYVQTWIPANDGLTPNDRAWWDAHIAANYRHARHFMRAARKAMTVLDAFANGRARQRQLKAALDRVLFDLSVVERARNDARHLRRERDRRFGV